MLSSVLSQVFTSSCNSNHPVARFCFNHRCRRFVDSNSWPVVTVILPGKRDLKVTCWRVGDFSVGGLYWHRSSGFSGPFCRKLIPFLKQLMTIRYYFTSIKMHWFKAANVFLISSSRFDSRRQVLIFHLVLFSHSCQLSVYFVIAVIRSFPRFVSVGCNFDVYPEPSYHSSFIGFHFERCSFFWPRSTPLLDVDGPAVVVCPMHGVAIVRL